MTIYTSRPEQSQRGYVAGPATFRFTGAWTPNTSYDRGDVIIDPGGTLRFCGVDHTSPVTFSVGSCYSATAVWWLPLPTNGTFRGPYQAGSQYVADDLLLGPDGSLTRALYADSGAGSSWDPTKFADLGVKSPFAPFGADVLLPPIGVPNTDVTGHGLFPLRSRLRYPAVKPLAVFHTPGDFSSLSGAGAGGAGSDPDPLTPQGSPLLPFSTAATKLLAAPVDLSNAIVRFPVKIPGAGASRSSIQHGYFEVSSDGFSSGNYSHFEFVAHQDSHIADTCWGWAGAGPAEWTIGAGSGADLTSINAIRFNLIGATSMTCAVSHVTAIPSNPGGRAKCVIWFDDSYSNDWTTGLGDMVAYGFPGTIGTAGAVVSGPTPATLTSTMLRYLTEFHGWQSAVHYYFPNDGSDPSCQAGPGMEAWIMRSRHMLNSVGTWGADDYAYHDNTHMTAQNAPILRKYFRTARKFHNRPPKIETLPPVDPYAMWAYGSGAQDINDRGQMMMAYVDKAIAHNGLVQFAFENLNNTSNPQFPNLLAYLDSRRDQIDVVTLAQALAPWTAAP